VLQVGFSQANIASLTEAGGADSLGNGALNTSPLGIGFFPLRGFGQLSTLLEGFKLSLRAESEDACRLAGGTVGTKGAGTTILERKTGLDDLIASVIKGRSPTDSLSLVGTGDRLGLPVYVKVLMSKVTRYLVGTLGLGPNRAEQFNAQLFSTVNNTIGIHITSIHQMGLGRVAFIGQGLVNGFSHNDIW
jgi:hypothetical protein